MTPAPKATAKASIARAIDSPVKVSRSMQAKMQEIAVQAEISIVFSAIQSDAELIFFATLS